MAMTALNALLNEPQDPPKPPPKPPKQATTAFQRNLAEQRAAARNAPDPTPSRAAPAPTRTPRQNAQAASNRTSSERESRPSSHTERQSSQSDVVFVAPGYVGAWGGGGGGQGGGQGNLAGTPVTMPGTADEGDLDCAMLLDVLPGDGDSGIFELLLPGGDRLAVVADIMQRQASFLLTPSSDRLRQLLNKRKMELEKGLEQRMDRHVRLTVL